MSSPIICSDHFEMKEKDEAGTNILFSNPKDLIIQENLRVLAQQDHPCIAAFENNLQSIQVDLNFSHLRDLYAFQKCTGTSLN